MTTSRIFALLSFLALPACGGGGASGPAAPSSIATPTPLSAATPSPAPLSTLTPSPIASRTAAPSPTPSPAAVSQYRVNAVFAPLTPADANYADFNMFVLPNRSITGVSLLLAWNSIESNSVPGSYNFSTFDSNIAHFISAGKIVNLIVAPVSEGGVNRFTPAYVFTPAWALSCCNAPPVDVVTCNTYPGNGTPNSGTPVVYEAPFQTAYKSFIAAVLSHYNNNSAVPIGYIRFGMVQGGEVIPLCNAVWPGYSKAFFLSYVQNMTQYIGAQRSSITQLADLNSVGSSPDLGYADAEAGYAVASGLGFGTNGLQVSDITNYSAGGRCTSDWCAMFDQYTGSVLSTGRPITLSLQTLLASDPTGVLATGSLVQLLPFVKQRHTTNLELYVTDLLLAFDPNYSSSVGATASYASYASAYAAAIAAFGS